VLNNRQQVNAITAQASRLVALDLRDLTRLFASKLVPLLTTTSKVSINSTAATRYVDASTAHAADIASLLKFFKDTVPEVQSHLTQSAKVFSRMGVKMPSALSDAELALTAGRTSSEEAVDRLASGQTRGGARQIEEEDEDEEEDDEVCECGFNDINL
jgi:hypothetical protein